MQTAIARRALKSEWARYREENPRARIRDAAVALRVSEAELLATGCGETVTRLGGEARDIIGLAPALGRVLALTRNHAAVHERKGVYGPLSTEGSAGLVVGKDIDLRIFFNRFCHAFAVREARRSLQFFDALGHAVHKIFLEPDGDAAAFDRIVELFEHDDQRTELEVERNVPPPAALDATVDPIELRLAWDGLLDTHDFVKLLRRFGVGRLQAFELAGSARAFEVQPLSAEPLLRRAASDGTPIMVFVASAGVIQIHTGPVHRVVPTGPWINVLDEHFNLHLRQDLVASAWVVRKPTRDGMVTSLELFDSTGELIAIFFGERKPGRPELEAWRDIVGDTCEAR